MRWKQTALPLAPPSQWTTVTLGELLERFLADRSKNVAGQTSANYRSACRTIGGVEINGRPVADMLIEDIGPIEIQSVCDMIAADRGRASASIARGVVAMAWQWGAKPTRGLVPNGIANPCDEVEAPRPRPDVPEIDATIMRALWDACDVVEAMPCSLAHRKTRAAALPFLRLLMLTGLRPWSEALPMTCAQLFRTGRGRWAVRIAKHKTANSRGPKAITLGTKAAAILLARRDAVGGRGLLWPRVRAGGKGRSTGHMHERPVSRVFRLVVAEASKHVDLDPRLYTYCLRHGFATAALEAGATLTAVKNALTHESHQTTLRYLRSVPGQEGETADLMASHTIDGDGATIEDLARAIGSEPNMPAMLAVVRRACSVMGVRTLKEAESMPVNDAIVKSEWNHRLFAVACKRAGISTAEELCARVNAHRKSIGNDTPYDERSARRHFAVDRKPGSVAQAAELADITGVSLDWLCGRTLGTATTMEASA